MKIEGFISDSSGNPLSGATLFNHRTKTGVITDSKGAYRFDALPSDMIEVRYLGMQTQVFNADKLPKNLAMTDEVEALPEVVVTHTPTPKKEEKPQVTPSGNDQLKKSKMWLWIALGIVAVGVGWGIVSSQKKSKKVSV